jgi:hypothetical protein
MDDLLGSAAALALSPGGQDTETLRRVSELKKELRKLVNFITDEDECRIGLFDQISNTLAALKDIKFKKRTEGNGSASTSQRLSNIAVPEHFLCPISSQLMRDPVILATGETYDRAFIQAWLQAGNRTCPKTKQVLPHLILTPNYLVQSMIEQWCESRGLEAPMRAAARNRDGDESTLTKSGITLEEQKYLGILLEKIVQEKESREAARELRELTKTKPSHRAYLGQGKTRAIPLLVSLLLSSDSETQEHAVTALLNLSIHDANKTAIAAQGAIPCIVQVLRDGGTMEARGNAAAALFSLSAVDENKAKIGASGALPALVDLLSDGNAMAKKDSASALFNLCIHRENRIPCVRAGMIHVLLKLVSNHSEGLVDESLALLAMVAAHHEAAEAMGNAGAVSCLMDIIKDGSQHPRNKENAVVTLQAICLNDRSHFKKMRGDRNGCINALIDLSESGTSRAKRKASAILDRMMKQEHMSTI